MNIEFTYLNGKSNLFDNEHFEETIKNILSKTCSEAQIFLLNNFPVLISTESHLDLLLIINILDKKGNYFVTHRQEKRNIYLKNLIIPISFQNQYEGESIEINEDNKDELLISSNPVNYGIDSNNIKFGLSNT